MQLVQERSVEVRAVPSPAELIDQVPLPRVSPAAIVTVPEAESRVKADAPPEARIRAPLPVILPILTRLPEESIRCVPAPAPVLMPAVAFKVVPVIVLEVTRVPVIFRFAERSN